MNIVGSNEFTPGTNVPFKIQIQNTGLNKIKFVQSTIIERDDNPNTAKMVTVSLLPGDSPALIKSDPQMIGDIGGSQTVPVSFEILIPDEAKTGTYYLPVTLNYTYLQDAEQEGTDTITYRYVEANKSFKIPFKVQSAITLQVEDTKAENLVAGGSGYITISLKNVGTNTGDNAIVTLNRSENSPIIPVSSSVYIGTFVPGNITTAKFKVKVSKDAETQDYPITVSVIYDNADGQTIVSPSQKVGIPVSSDIDFTIISKPPELKPGKNNIEVTYRNDGSVTVYGAEVRISAVDPFTSSDDLSYLGDLKPGESRSARFGLTVDPEANTKIYGLDSEVKYRDALDDTHVSDTIKVPLIVVSNNGLEAFIFNPVIIGLLIILILGGGYYLREYRSKFAIP